MHDLFDKIGQATTYLSAFIQKKPAIAILTGTGMGSLEQALTDAIELPYSQIPHFPVSSVSSHRGSLFFGILEGQPVMLLSGRFHYYEGYEPVELTFPVRVARALGATHLIMTNAAGGLNPHFSEGDIVLVSDHINLMPSHPLRGVNDDRLGLRFPDMMHAYDPDLQAEFHQLAMEMNICLRSGVYLALQGPSLETPAEYNMARLLGADLVGMSTVPEVIVARHEKMKVTVFSIVSNVCFPPSRLTETTLESVLEVVGKSAGTISSLLKMYFSRLS
jgi:purine-nucleoside phosphorylase